jgi:hypothetical protein
MATVKTRAGTEKTTKKSALSMIGPPDEITEITSIPQGVATDFRSPNFFVTRPFYNE